ncbi:C6 transcription factor [Ophiocordyceps camponoti-floridani]|uniref:C6 transcription factor n=1 Tax=Ophiocordyceps camponoti-floridani TaxID=2030778 RepID=A0A8H4Q672_9HYPO|nr:C6 transcription factor [Ophiocordyceps camponoti-floridani]
MSKQAKPIDLPVVPPVPVENHDENEPEKPGDGGTSQPTEGNPQAPPGSQWHAHGFPAVSRHRFLSSAEWATIAAGIGGVSDVEGHKPVKPTSWWWPPRGMPRGLYRDIVTRRTKF